LWLKSSGAKTFRFAFLRTPTNKIPLKLFDLHPTGERKGSATKEMGGEMMMILVVVVVVVVGGGGRIGRFGGACNVRKT
jgi:hypothetical protein